MRRKTRSSGSPARRRILKRTQEADGSWAGRWGVNYIYGTFLALRGLEAAGESDREAYILRAGEWLRSIQNADGGWGESCAGYAQNTFVPAPSAPSQTAWAILGLLASGDTTSGSVQQGVEYLMETQRPRRRLGRRIIHRHRFPGRLLLAVSLLPPLVPGAGSVQLPEGEKRKRSRPIMRVPLSQVADMATYIAKNKLRPKPEWQKNVAPTEDLSNPFKIVHTQIPSAKSDRKPHPMINKRFPLVMMLEPLHACNLTCTGCGRIREYEDSIRDRRVAGELSESCRRVRRAHGLDLRRRTTAAARHRRDVRGDPEARTLHSALH